MKLLRLLYLRTQYGPEVWLPFDTTEARGAWKSGLVDSEYADNSVVMYGAEYGKLTHWTLYVRTEGRQWGTRGLVL
jgi:hypothetical protein